MGTNNSINSSTSGIMANNSAGSIFGRTLTAGASGALSVTNGSGVAGNPTIDIVAPLSVANGGTGDTTLTAHALLVGEGTSAVAFVGPSATSGTILQSAGASSDPTFSTATYPSTTTINQLLFSSAANTVGGLATANSASLVTNSTGVPAFSSTMTNGQVIIGSTGATPTAATLTAGSGISVTNAAGSITIAATGAGFTWNDTTGTSATIVVENGYVADNAGLVTFTLPATANFGDSFIVMGKGAGGWKIAQNASQQIQFSSTATTVGTGGSLATTNQFDSVTCTCITAGASTVWGVRSSMGNITVT